MLLLASGAVFEPALRFGQGLRQDAGAARPAVGALETVPQRVRPRKCSMTLSLSLSLSGTPSLLTPHLTTPRLNPLVGVATHPVAAGSSLAAGGYGKWGS